MGERLKVSWFARAGFWLAALAAVAAVLAGWGSREGWWHFRVGFSLLKWAAYGAAAAVALAFLPAALAGGLGLAALGLHYGVGLALLAIGLVLFWRGILGGGDVKLLAAVGVWIGLDDLLLYLVVMSFLGGALALTVMAAARLKRAWPALDRIPWLGDGAPRTQAIPYGIAIGLAALALAARSPALPPAWAALLH